MASLLDLFQAGQLPQPGMPDPWRELDEIIARQGEQGAAGARKSSDVPPDMSPFETMVTRNVETEAPATAATFAPRAAPAAPAGPTSGGGLGAILANLGRGEGIIPTIANVMQGPSRENETVRVLIQRGELDEQTARIVARNPEMMRQLIPKMFASKAQKLGPGEIVGMPDPLNPGGPMKEVFRNEPRDVVLPHGAVQSRDGSIIARNEPRDTVAPAGSGVLRDGKLIHTQPKEMSAADKKAIFDAENDLPAIEDTIKKLKTAKDLNPKVNTGLFAKQRGQLGAMMPLPTEGDKATVEWHKMMEPAAIKEMSATLKGASTDREMFQYLSMIADSSIPPEIRERIIDKAIALAEHSKTIATDRFNQLRSGTYYGREGGQSSQRQPASGAGGAWKDLGNGIRIREKP